MFFPKTGELETFWTNYTCGNPSCPGKHRQTRGSTSHAMKMREWTQLPSGRMRKRLMIDGTEDESGNR
jgi:hypothetical protein